MDGLCLWSSLYAPGTTILETCYQHFLFWLFLFWAPIAYQSLILFNQITVKLDTTLSGLCLSSDDYSLSLRKRPYFHFKVLGILTWKADDPLHRHWQCRNEEEMKQVIAQEVQPRWWCCLGLVTQWVGALSHKPEDWGLIPSQGTSLSCGFDSLVNGRQTIDISHISVSLFLSSSSFLSKIQ